MAQIEIDTKELKDRGSNIQNITKDFNVKLNSLYKRLEEVPSVSFEWVGSSSTKFASIVKNDKEKYYRLKDDLDMYGKFLIDFSDSVDDLIKEVRRMF